MPHDPTEPDQAGETPSESDEPSDTYEHDAGDEEGPAEAIRRIATAKFNRARSLDLSGLHLDQLPDELGQLKDSLVYLHAADNRLCSTDQLVRVLSQLTRLEVLRLDTNRFDSTDALSEAVHTLPNIRAVNLSHNRLRDFHDIMHLVQAAPSLSFLMLSHNDIATPTAAINVAALDSALQDLWLGFNDFSNVECLIPFVTSLPRLRFLDLSSTNITLDVDMVCALLRIRTLIALSLSGNHASQVSHHNNGLSGPALLGFLNIDDVDLSRSDPVLYKLCESKSLHTLSLRNCRLRSTDQLCDSLRGLAHLEILNIENNNLSITPSMTGAMSTLKRLKELGCTGNKGLRLPEETAASRDAQRIIRAIEEISGGRTQAEPEFKVAILGETRAGKTQLRRLLVGNDPIRDDEVTHSFEWQQIEASISKPGAEVPGRVHVFDFGGQRRLWGSHRFFLSTRRSIYIICIPLIWSIEKARLSHWLKLVEDLAEQAAREEAVRTKDNADARGDTSHSFEELLHEARERSPRPPIIVVITHSDAEERLKLNIEEARSLCETYNAMLIEGYDAFCDPSRRADCVGPVLQAIKEAACSEHPSMQKVWTEQFPTKSLDQRQTIKDRFGFDPTGLNPDPHTRSMTVEDYLLDVCGLDRATVEARKDREYDLAIDALELLRDLGFAHWLGNRNDLDLKRQPIYSPAWVRQPIYNVLWHEDPATAPIAASRLRNLLCKTHQLTDLELADITKLMQRCDLIFEMQDRDGRQHYLVPDRLDPGDEHTLIKDDRDFAKSERGYRLDLGYAPDHLMPCLIGRFFARRDHACRHMTRRSVDVDVNDSEARVRIDLDQASAILRVGILADDAVRMRFIATLQSHVADILRPRHVDDLRLLSQQIVKSEENVASLKHSLRDLIAEVCKDLAEREAQRLATWISLCDEHLPQAGSWKIGVLAGVYRATEKLEPDWHSNHADFVRALLESLSRWNTRADIPEDWLNELRTLAPQGLRGIDSRFETTKTTWGKVRKSLAQKHPWLAPNFGRAADRRSDHHRGDIRASGTRRDDD